VLIVIAPATSNRLTTIARARAFLGFSDADDPAVDILIGRASAAIVEWCRRPFALETVRETNDEHSRHFGVMLSRSPVTSIRSVVRDGIPLNETEYAIDPRNGMLRDIVDESGFRFQWWWRAKLVIDYSAGYLLPTDDSDGTLPPAVERAAILLVAAFLSTSGWDDPSDEAEGSSRTPWPPGSVCEMAFPDAERLLQPYRRLIVR